MTTATRTDKASSNGHKPDEDEQARQWIANLRKENRQSLPPFQTCQKWSPYLVYLDRAHLAGGSPAVEATISSMLQSPKQWPGFADLLNPPKKQEPPLAGEEDGMFIPQLPEWAQMPEGASKDACPWLEEYIKWSRRVSPEGCDAFHQACGLWLLSTIAARRVGIGWDAKTSYTALYIALVARSTRHKKSSTAEVAKGVLHQANLSFFLGPDKTSPQKLLQDMAGRLSSKYGEDETKKPFLEHCLRFSAQRGWFYDEFGQHLDDMTKKGGVMSEFKGVLRTFYNCDQPTYINTTIGRGDDIVENPYLALLGSMTPTDLKPHAKRGASFFHDGLFARFAFVTAPQTPINSPYKRRDPNMPTTKIYAPPEVVEPLKEWHVRLGEPVLYIDEKKDKNQNGTGEYTWSRGDFPETIYDVSDDAYQAWVNYRNALQQMADQNGNNHDFDATYERFASMAITIAALFTSLQGLSTFIELRHWARAQEIVEQWRQNLHEIYAQVNSSTEPSAEEIIDEAVVTALSKYGQLAVREMKQKHWPLHSVPSARIEDCLKILLDGGVVARVKGISAKKYQLVSLAEESEANKQEEPAW